MYLFILPNNIPVTQDLSFRLRLDVHFDKNIEMAIPNLGLLQTTSGISIQDSKDDISQGLDIDFEIERTSGSEPSIAEIKIWNLSDSTFNQIANHGNLFELYFAKGNDDWGLLFRGTPYFSTQKGGSGGNNTSRGFLKKDDATGGENDVATIISLLDSLHSFGSATMSKSYQGTISTKTIIQDCVTAMGIQLGDEVEYPQINNYVARGSCARILNEICGKIGCKHIIENGILHLFNSNSTKYYGYLFNGDNSSKPQREQEDNIQLYHFTTQLMPNLRAGQYCMCDFFTLTGKREIYKVVLTGNNYGTSGQAEIWVK
jgi:hypothetical protein